MVADTWILIADSHRARLYSAPPVGEPWTLLKECSPTAAPSRRETDIDRHEIQYSSLKPQAPAQMIATARFAQDLVDILHHGYEQQFCKRIRLVAPPDFLGLLRKGLDESIQHC